MKVKKACVRIIILLAIFCSDSQSKAQTFIWDAGFNGFFDNREYYHEFAKPQTLFGVRTYALAGATLHENYSIGIGLDALDEFGSKIRGEDICPIIFFRYQKDPLKFLFGSFHRKGLSILPYVLQADTIQYYKPTIEGMFLGFRKSWGFQNIWIDWISRQTDTDNEIFTIGGSGAYNHSIFFYKHDFIMTHVASTAKSESDEHIRDNGGFYARIGFCNLNKGFPDSLSLSTGYTMSYNRIRNVTGFLYRNGSLTEIYFEYQDIGLKSSLYFGDGQLLIGGDDLYSSPYYIRNDLFWMFFRRSNITGKLEISLHIVEHLINFSQSFQLSVNLGGTHKANSEIKNPTR